MSWFQLNHMNIILLAAWLKRQNTDAECTKWTDRVKMWQLVNRQGQSKAPAERKKNMCYSNEVARGFTLKSHSPIVTVRQDGQRAQCAKSPKQTDCAHIQPMMDRASPVTFRRWREHMAYLKDSMRAPELWWWRWCWPVHRNTILLFYPLPACRWCFN